MARTFLLDGTALAYRAHFALAGRGDGLTTSDGHPTSAIYGFILTLRALLKREQVDRIAVAFDGPTQALERTARFPEYKATREKAPDELKMQFDDVREVVEAWGIPILELPGQEADDVIGTLAVRCRDAGDEVFIVTGDKDFMQLVDEHLKLYDIMQRGSSEPRIVGPAEVVEKFGVPPARIVDLLALMGDSSDNIPGVRGIGAKTAADLLRQHESLDAVLDAAPSVTKPKLRENLIQDRELALLSRDLVRIRTDLDLPVQPRDLGPPAPDPARLLDLDRRLEFRQLANELVAEAGSDQRDQERIDYRTVESLEECRALVRRLQHVPAFALETVTDADATGATELVGLAFATAATKGWYVPLRGPDLPAGHDRDAWLAGFAPLLASDTPRKLGHDVKRHVKALHQEGVRVRGFAFDAALASYCIAPGVRPHDLGALVQHYCELHQKPRNQLTGSGKKTVPIATVPIAEVGPWAAAAADHAWRLQEPLRGEIDAFRVGSVFDEIEMPLVEVLAEMEERGIRLDTDYMAELGVGMASRLEELTKEIWRHAGEEFNIASNQQLGRVLFDKLEIHKATRTRAPRRTATGQWATDQSVLENLGEHPLGALLLEWRRLSKLKSTYVDALPVLVRPTTGRLHTSFNQWVAATGRLSSEEPNLQNIPIRTEEGRQLRRAFVPGEPDWVLLSADYSQIELRILAHLSGDENLQAGFRKGEDVHARTASIVFGVMPALVDGHMRSQAKVVNYGLVYGMGVQRLAAETGLSPAEARKFMDAYFRAMPRVKQWLDATLEEARASGEVRTLFGRRRPLPDIDAKAPQIRANAQNVAVNSPIQGTAADVIKRAMIHLHAAIRSRKLAGRLLLQVHDELVLECPAAEAAAMEALVRECMEGAADLAVPLAVEVGVGHNWLEAHA